jgi:hypothetical protein
MPPSNITAVRWRATDSRRCHAFPAPAENHPLVRHSVACLICNELLAGNRIQLLAIGPFEDDDEAQDRHDSGGWYTAMAAVVHERCLSELSDDQVEKLIGELAEVPAP